MREGLGEQEKEGCSSRTKPRKSITRGENRNRTEHFEKVEWEVIA
jgi:hypothetical protein